MVDPGLANDEQFERQALAAARWRRVPIVLGRRGVSLRAGAFALRLLGPRHVVAGEDPNSAALVVMAEWGACRVLLPADAEAPGLLPLDPPSVNVLEVAHHGSADPSLARAPASRASAARGHLGRRRQLYGHPADSILATLSAAEIPVERTDRDGDVSVACPG